MTREDQIELLGILEKLSDREHDKDTVHDLSYAKKIIRNNLEKFPITYLTREDIRRCGYVDAFLSDDDIVEIANKVEVGLPFNEVLSSELESRDAKTWQDVSNSVLSDVFAGVLPEMEVPDDSITAFIETFTNAKDYSDIMDLGRDKEQFNIIMSNFLKAIKRVTGQSLYIYEIDILRKFVEDAD